MLLQRLTQAFEKNKVQYAIAGGWAVALHGAVRGTVDIDVLLVLNKENLKRAQSALKTIGLEPRLPVTADDLIDFRQEYIRNKKMLAWRFINPTDHTEVVDLLILEDLQGLQVAKIKVGGKAIPVLARADLIRMKRASGRPQDLEDVRALESLER